MLSEKSPKSGPVPGPPGPEHFPASQPGPVAATASISKGDHSELKSKKYFGRNITILTPVLTCQNGKNLKISRETRAQAEMNVISQLFSSNIAQKSFFFFACGADWGATPPRPPDLSTRSPESISPAAVWSGLPESEP